MKAKGPAFPEIRIEKSGDGPGAHTVEVYYPGMSLRAWLVGKALTGAALKDPDDREVNRMVLDARCIADAAIAELLKEV